MTAITPSPAAPATSFLASNLSIQAPPRAMSWLTFSASVSCMAYWWYWLPQRRSSSFFRPRVGNAADRHGHQRRGPRVDGALRRRAVGGSPGTGSVACIRRPALQSAGKRTREGFHARRPAALAKKGHGKRGTRGRRSGSPPYPASGRQGCTLTPPRPIITLSVIRLPHLAQRNFRSLSGTSPLPASMMACRSAGPWCRQALHQTGRAKRPWAACCEQSGGRSRPFAGQGGYQQALRLARCTVRIVPGRESEVHAGPILCVKDDEAVALAVLSPPH